MEDSARSTPVETPSRVNTPGKGLPWSPRSMGTPSELAARDAAVARARRSDRRSDADAIARFIDVEWSESSESARDVDVGVKTDVATTRRIKVTPWGALVQYLRCCVSIRSTTSEFERAAESTDATESIPQKRDLRAACIPCVSDASTVCVPSGFVLHEGAPFIGEQDLEWDEARWSAHAGPLGERPKGELAMPRFKPCLVLDLDETLVHSSFKPVPNSDFVVSVEIDGAMTDVHVLKRPWVDHFLREVSQDWEIVVFTASLPKYANPVMNLLDADNLVRWRLFRRHCYAFQGNYVKDLTCLGRDLTQTVIIDNSPHSYVFHPQNAFPISSFVDDSSDNELLNAIPYLRTLARSMDVRDQLKRTRGYTPRQPYFSHRGIDTPSLDRVGQQIV